MKSEERREERERKEKREERKEREEREREREERERDMSCFHIRTVACQVIREKREEREREREREKREERREKREERREKREERREERREKREKRGEREAKKRRSGASTSQTSHAGLGDGSLGRHSRPRHKARPRCAALWPGSATSSVRGAAQRTPSCSRSDGWDGARSRKGISPPTMARRSTSWQWRRRRCVFGWIRLPSCGPTALHTGTSPKCPLIWEAIRPLLVSGKLEGWSLWHRNVLVKLVSRGVLTQERQVRLRGEDDGSCQLCNEGPGTMFHRCYECPALQAERKRDMHVSQEVRHGALSLGSQYREQFAGIFHDPAAILPTGSPECACTVLWHNRPPYGLREGHSFTDGSSSGKRCAAAGRLGCGGGRQRWEPQGSSFWGQC